ncbi:hypothetical protein nbrc107696_34780 [Gordonia spumicola]|uniref:LGFP repeat-containing protein n=1 Tax=Gordonia spumicola TaxID=589161 RepID=A0A7I9VCV8_9ACTN|nr:hypothetical protein [Gordonia spumicola]GEE03032.1 hypothetical protein nbrc107696_34780 [Gordonia spumicola]
MRQNMRRTAGVAAALAVTAAVLAGCSDDKSDDASASTTATSAATTTSSAAAAKPVELTSTDGKEVTLTGPIAAKYSAATDKQRKDLGKPKAGKGEAGTSESGVVFQQFVGGVITAKNAEAGTPAFITWGKIRDAWNVKRDEHGKPSAHGKSGSNGPLGAATSDETDEGTLKKSTFEHGEITFDTKTDKIKVTVMGKEVAAK